MIDKVVSSIKKHNMIPRNVTVVAAVSGGSDSMAMLHILNSLKSEYDFNIVAAHVNHCLRGESADADEALVVSECGKIGVPVKVLRVDVAAKAKELGLGFEECGRKLRYEFFSSAGDDIIIATAHNLNDRAETFLFNFARGTTLRGLCSIPATRDNIIRPLIDCTKEEIIDFCKVNGIPFAEDATNSDVHYARNRIRHNVITELKEINPSFERSVSRCVDSIAEDERFLSDMAIQLCEKAKNQSGYDAKMLSDSPASLKRRAVVFITEKETGITPEYEAVNKICGLLESGGNCMINGAVTVRVRKNILDFPEKESQRFSAEVLEIGRKYFGNVSVTATVHDITETNYSQIISKQSTDYCLDYDKISGDMIVRSREAGDRISLAERGCGKTLKKLFNELSIPPEKRNEIIVIADEKGIIFVENIGCDKRLSVTKETQKVLCIRIERN